MVNGLLVAACLSLPTLSTTPSCLSIITGHLDTGEPHATSDASVMNCVFIFS